VISRPTLAKCPAGNEHGCRTICQFRLPNNRLAEPLYKSTSFFETVQQRPSGWGRRRVVWPGTRPRGSLQTELAYREARSRQRRAALPLFEYVRTHNLFSGRLPSPAMPLEGPAVAVFLRSAPAPMFGLRVG